MEEIRRQNDADVLKIRDETEAAYERKVQTNHLELFDFAAMHYYVYLRRDFQSETCLRLLKFWLSYVRERKRLLKINAFNIG